MSVTAGSTYENNFDRTLSLTSEESASAEGGKCVCVHACCS